MSTMSTTRTITEEISDVPQNGILDIEGSGFDFEEGADEKGDFLPAPLNERRRSPSHPGAILHNLYMPQTGLTPARFARGIGVSPRTVRLFLEGQRPLTADLAHRLARALSTSVELWINLQRDYDLWEATHNHAAEYERIQPLTLKAA